MSCSEHLIVLACPPPPPFFFWQSEYLMIATIVLESVCLGMGKMLQVEEEPLIGVMKQSKSRDKLC